MSALWKIILDKGVLLLYNRHNLNTETIEAEVKLHGASTESSA